MGGPGIFKPGMKSQNFGLGLARLRYTQQLEYRNSGREGAREFVVRNYYASNASPIRATILNTCHSSKITL